MDPKILIIGGNGFVGTNLIHYFEKNNTPIRVMARTPSKVLSEKDSTKVVFGDLNDRESLRSSLEDITTIYFLAHAMDSEDDRFIETEKQHANNIAHFLTASHRIIYLGGIIPDHELSQHLKSRFEVGQIFKDSMATTIEFRASIIIGQGSTSYEMVRALVNRLPFLLKADWMNSLCQPIAISDVILYLSQAKDISLEDKYSIFEIGGSDQLTYFDLIQSYVRFSKKIRPIIEIHKFPKHLAAELLKIVSPEYYQVGRKLLQSIEHPTIVTNIKAKERFGISAISLSKAMEMTSEVDISEISITELMSKLKLNSEMPQYLTGQILQLYFTIPSGFDYVSMLERIQKVMPYEFEIKNEIQLSIPLGGTFKISFEESKNSLIISYAPKYFFQSLGWVFWKQIIVQLSKITVEKTK